MRKLITILLVATLSIGSAACGSKNEEPKKETTQTKAKKITLSTIEEKMLADGVISDGKIPVAAAMIGAEEGFKYKDDGVEVYRFDTASEAYAAAVESNTVIVEGFNMVLDVAAIKDGFVLIFTNDSNRKVIDSFNSVFE